MTWNQCLGFIEDLGPTLGPAIMTIDSITKIARLPPTWYPFLTNFQCVVHVDPRIVSVDSTIFAKSKHHHESFNAWWSLFYILLTLPKINMLPLNNDAWDDSTLSPILMVRWEHYPKWKEPTSWRDPFLTEPCLWEVPGNYILSLYKQMAP